MAAARAASDSKVESDSSSSESDRRLITLLVALPCFLLAAIGSGRVIVFVLTTAALARPFRSCFHVAS